MPTTDHSDETGILGADPAWAGVECSPAVLDEIRRHAVDGFNSFGHGGLEIGGVLFGTRGTVIRVMTSAPVDCDHSLGPGFSLSIHDQDKLAALLQSPREHEGVALEPVGWYRSVTRSGIRLNERDRVLFDRFFPGVWQIAVVVKPTRWGPATAGVFVRDTEGAILHEQPAAEFPLPVAGLGAAPAAEPEPAANPAAAAPAVALEHPPEPTEIQPTPQPAPAVEPPPVTTFRPMEPGSRRSGWFVVAAALLIVFAAMAWTYWPQRTPAVASLGLRALGFDRQIHVGWDHSSASIVNSAGGVLEVTDGSYRTSLELSSEQLRTGSITYEPRSGNVFLRLRVLPSGGGAPMEETTRYLVPARPQPAHAAPETPSIEKEPPAAAPKPEAFREETASREVAAPAEPSRKPPLRTLTLAAVEETRQAASLPPPPTVDSVVSPTHSPLEATTAVPRLPQPAVAPAAPVYRGPRSGRIIWTGRLEKRGVVEIENGKPSVGAVTGALPGVPVRVRVSPAEFVPRGLMIYSNDGSINGSPRREAPSRANGWNQTTFQYEPLRANELVLLEQPSPANNFGRLALRSDARICTVIVIEWTVR